MMKVLMRRFACLGLAEAHYFLSLRRLRAGFRRHPGAGEDGLFLVQEAYFQSWIVWWNAPSGNFRIPAFPGGHLIGALLLLNLIASMITRHIWSWKKLGIQLIHIGIIIMLVGGLATDLFSVHSYMRIKEGETKNYSEDSVRMELAVIDHSDPQAEQVTAIPESGSPK
jgi:hypothetical protein